MILFQNLKIQNNNWKCIENNFCESDSVGKYENVIHLQSIKNQSLDENSDVTSFEN